ncbi:Zn-ribbon domain-containing OB-fold protein [Phaeacidiphilus oryzae]|uniref:Zn-ribbon domain-containing OB-fold protein n=1 Tax=Phaeacidiphilus oryzae TaxID=348818 RepID=UPI000B2D900E|nr:OB-fold domain-containing protein [Phaeacidiphilus oryzae]
MSAQIGRSSQFGQSSQIGQISRIPYVDYLVLGPEPHLVAHECAECGARYFDRRNACASCGGTEFAPADLPTTGEVTSFTIVTAAAPGIPVPYAAAVVDCGGTKVAGNIIGTEPDPGHIRLGMRVALSTYVAGTDGKGVDAVNFGFAPLEDGASEGRN